MRGAVLRAGAHFLTEYTFSPDGGCGTLMTLRNHGQPAGFSVLAAPLMSLAMRCANQKDLTAIKALLEGGQG